MAAGCDKANITQQDFWLTFKNIHSFCSINRKLTKRAERKFPNRKAIRVKRIWMTFKGKAAKSTSEVLINLISNRCLFYLLWLSDLIKNPRSVIWLQDLTQQRLHLMTAKRLSIFSDTVSLNLQILLTGLALLPNCSVFVSSGRYRRNSSKKVSICVRFVPADIKEELSTWTDCTLSNEDIQWSASCWNRFKGLSSEETPALSCCIMKDCCLPAFTTLARCLVELLWTRHSCLNFYQACKTAKQVSLISTNSLLVQLIKEKRHESRNV